MNQILATLPANAAERAAGLTSIVTIAAEGSIWVGSETTQTRPKYYRSLIDRPLLECPLSVATVIDGSE